MLSEKDLKIGNWILLDGKETQVTGKLLYQLELGLE